MSKDFQFIVDEEIHDMIHNITYMDNKANLRDLKAATGL